jgi:hypothetical protein
MKRTYIFVGSCVFVCLLFACKKPSTIQLQNNISTVRITNVKWGDILLSNELLPGESSGKRTVDSYQEKLPKTARVIFKMEANNKTVYLETEEEFTLKEDDELLITLSDDTQVRNPNN